MFANRHGRIQIGYILLAFVFTFTFTPYHIAASTGNPERIFYGRADHEAVLENLDYQDVKNSDTWAKDAIWETGALELMKGYGAKRFGLSDMLTIEQALAVAYNMAGREAEAQLAAEALDLQRNAGERKSYAPAMWSDGYIQLALNDGLITQEDYDDAFAGDQAGLGPGDFRRGSPASREDMAFYIARVLELTPINSQTHLFNSYIDWQEANPHRIPYIETILQNRIMNGSNGSFDPKGPVTREQAAQILLNAEPFLFSRLNMEKMKGTIETITSYEDKTHGERSTITEVNVRNSSGELHQFRFSHPDSTYGANEITGSSNPQSNGTIVNENGVLSDPSTLREGQNITYIVCNGQVYYVVVMAGQESAAYRLAKIISVNENDRSVRCEVLADVPFSDIRLLNTGTLMSGNQTGTVEVLTVSDNCSVSFGYTPKSLKEVQPETVMLLTLKNGLITAMEKVNTDLFQERGIVSGIVEENNPVLGYITLYFPDGSGVSPEADISLASFRTYSWTDAGILDVYKNGKAAGIEDIKPGDSVFLKLNEYGNVVRVSGADNFYPVYGKVRTKGTGILQLVKQDGMVEQLRIPSDTPVFRENKRVTWNDLSEGDNVKILMQTAGSQVIIGEITIEKNTIETSGIYKGQMSYYDSLNEGIVLTGLQQFINGIWKPSGERGVTNLPLNEAYHPEIPKGASGTVYIATGKDILGRNTIIRMLIDGESISDEVLSDTIVQAQPGQGSLMLLNGNTPVHYGDESLIIKSGKLLEPNQVKSQDEATIVAGSLPDGSKKANIVWLQETVSDTGLTLLRGRISRIEALTSVTLQSFSEFRSPSWEFYNVQKTLTIDPYITRILADDGRTDPAEFIDTGTTNYKNRTVYVVAREGKALLISTAPYGDVVLSGRIAKLSGTVTDSFGHVVTPPSSLLMNSVTAFNTATWNWERKSDTELMLPVNAVICKNGEIVDAGQLKEGDRITVIRGISGDSAYVILAEAY